MQVPPALCMAQGQPSGNGHIIDHLNLELLWYIHVIVHVQGTLRDTVQLNVYMVMVL